MRADYLDISDFLLFFAVIILIDNRQLTFLAIFRFGYWGAGGGRFLEEVCQPQNLFPCWFVKAILLTFKVQNRAHLFTQAFA